MGDAEIETATLSVSGKRVTAAPIDRGGRVEEVSGTWAEDVPFVLAPDTDAVRRHAGGLGLL